MSESRLRGGTTSSGPEEKKGTAAHELLIAAGLVRGAALPDHLKVFELQINQVLHIVEEEIRAGEMTKAQGTAFRDLLVKTARRVLNHPIIADNRYLSRFARGVTFAQARHEIQQFSVFGIHFDIALAKLVANAPTREAYAERLKILLNEKGIPFKDGFEGELTGLWSEKTVHFTWLQAMAAGFGLRFENIGKISIGQPGTVRFVNTVFDTFANTDQSIASGASFATENWAANALWDPWIEGMQKLNQTLDKPVDVGYLTYHQAEEKHHSQSTLMELLDNFKLPWFEAEKFFNGAETVLTEGVQAYYASQLNTLPDKEGNDWPAVVCGAVRASA